MEEKEGLRHLFGRTRYVVLILGLLTLTFAFSNSLVFTFTIICMDDVEAEWLHSPTQVNSLFSAIAIGCLIGTLPISHFVQRFGVGFTCASYGLLSSLVTLFFPLAVNLGYPAVFVARAVQGIPTSLSFVAMGQISSQWSTEKGLGSFVALLSTYMQLCSVITMPISGAFCVSPIGWRGAYYLHGIVSMAIFIMFYLFYHDNPEQHRTVSERELERISRGKKHLAKDKKVPYGAILRDPRVWSLWIAIFGSTTGYQTFFLYGPTYLNKAVGLNVRATGWGTALPYLLSALLKLCLGRVSDKFTFVSQRTRLIFFTTLSQSLGAICLVVMSLTTSPILAQIAYTGMIVASGIVVVGTFRGASMVSHVIIKKISLQVARQHVHFVMAVCSFMLVLITFGVPAAVAFLCPGNTADEWATLFLFLAVFIMVATTPYCFFASDKPAKWTLAATQEKICPFDKVEKIKEAV